MFARHAFAASLGAALLATLPTMSSAETQTEWLLRQLQISDGGTQPAPQAMPGKETVGKTGSFEGAGLQSRQGKPGASTVSRTESQSEWLLRQLQVTDGYSPPAAEAMP